MQWDPKVWELLFSFVFILIGSFTFHISSIISGTSVFREYPTQFSTLMTLTIGIILFGMSPVSFLLLGPYLEQNIVPAQGVNIRLLIADILTTNTIVPFVLSASGFGLLFGATATLQAREMFLRWVRKSTNMQFGIKSYSLSWDAYLASIKSYGEINVEMEKKKIKGHLKHFSIRTEAKAIWLEKYTIHPIDSPEAGHSEPVEGDILISSDDIINISAPAYSFNKHYESMRHLSQAFYIVLIAVGLLFLSISVDGTAGFLNNPRYHATLEDVRAVYRISALLCLLAAFVMLLVVVKVLREDCSSWRATLDFYPEFLIAIVILIGFFTYIAFRMVISRLEFIAQYESVAIITLVFVTIGIWYYLLHRARPVKHAIFEIMALEDKSKFPLLSEFIDEIYTKSDANGRGLYQYNILPPLLDKKFENFRAMPQITIVLEELFAIRPYLREEMYNFVVKLRLCIKR